MPKVTCLAIGDPHFQVNNVTDSQEMIDKVNTVVETLQPTFVVILGDLLHTHEKIHTTPYNLATKLITTLARKVQVFLIIGNHDYISNQQYLTSNHAFNAFKKIDNVTVCDRVKIATIGKHKFVFCPYVPPDRFEEALDTLETRGCNWDDADCIFAHQEFYGCRFNPVMTSEIGDIWPNEYPLVISGHIHNKQWLQENIYYTGSSMQHAFGETANKTVAFIKFSTQCGVPPPQATELAIGALALHKADIQEIDLEMRRKKIVYLNLEEIDKFKPEENTLIKLVLKGHPTEFKVFRKSAEFKRLQKLNIVVSFSPINQVEDPEKVQPVQNKGVLEILSELIECENKYIKTAFTELKEKVLADNN